MIAPALWCQAWGVGRMARRSLLSGGSDLLSLCRLASPRRGWRYLLICSILKNLNNGMSFILEVSQDASTVVFSVSPRFGIAFICWWWCGCFAYRFGDRCPFAKGGSSVIRRGGRSFVSLSWQVPVAIVGQSATGNASSLPVLRYFTGVVL